MMMSIEKERKSYNLRAKITIIFNHAYMSPIFMTWQFNIFIFVVKEEIADLYNHP